MGKGHYSVGPDSLFACSANVFIVINVLSINHCHSCVIMLYVNLVMIVVLVMLFVLECPTPTLNPGPNWLPTFSKILFR